MSLGEVIRLVVHRGVYACSRRSFVCGLEVRYFVPIGTDAAEGWTKVRRAIELINEYDHARLGRIRRDLRGIVVFAASGLAEYWHDRRLCVLDEQYVLRPTVTAFDIAGTVAHEATHARLSRFGYAPEARARIERLCCLAELALADRFPAEAGAPMRQGAQALLARDPATTWSDAAVAQRNIQRLREFGTPRWLIRWIVRGRAAV